ncbi:MAG TPA: FAD-dependent monooxygenase [Rhodococcus sp. (in: high G+C Gram-positive bacteria)]|jgi:2-polyprenyl-6-methoxyphenol hydroxylase-like FAD-dependent oxidoreductase|nr:FAD-dependent monooxygenase [Rhodococcus sp. (in: high G+C Gram-positive bacteria)]
MSPLKILISGASIAGPALALLLGRNGYDVTVVERAPAVRPGGQAVDFKGRTHRRVLERMGVMDAVLAAQTPKTDIRLVDADGRIKAVMPGEFIGGDVEILRGDLASLLHEHAAQHAGFVFDDEIIALTEDAGGVAVSFAHGRDDRFDLVVGADGIHSVVRALAFGPETDHLRRLGYHYVVVNGDMSTDDLVTLLPDGRAVGYGYNEPGRFATLGGPKASQMFVFRTDPDVPGYDRHDVRTQKEFLARHFRGAGWRVPTMLDAALVADDFYLDELARTTMTSFTRRRVALVGDSGYANTLGGFGTGLAMVGAYVLAGELVAARGDHVAAFAAYDQRMRSLTAVARRGSAGPFLAPPSRLRIRLHDLTFANRTLFRTMMRLTDLFATDDSVPDYPLQ